MPAAMTDLSTAVPTRRGGADSARRLMEAAIDSFAHKGFHATSTRDVAARANMSAAGVYVHFASKEDLFFQLCRHGHVLALKIVTTARESADTPHPAEGDCLRLRPLARLTVFRTARIVQYEFPHLTPEHRAEILTLRKQIDAVVREVLTAGHDRGDFDVPDMP